MFLVIKNEELEDTKVRVINFKNITQFIVAPLGNYSDNSFVIQAEVETFNRVAHIFLSSRYKPFENMEDAYQALKDMLNTMSFIEKRGGNFYNITIHGLRSAEEKEDREDEDIETVLRRKTIM